VIEEDVTRLLEFDRGKLDVVVLRGEIATRLLAGDKLKPSTRREASRGRSSSSHISSRST
jgi:hypothetical protein